MNKTKHQKVVFSLSDVEYAIDIQTVVEIRGYDTVTQLANVPNYVKGIVNLRGLIVPIVDLRLRLDLGEPTYDTSTVVILVSLSGRTVGIVVDSVSDVITLDSEQIKPFPATKSQGNEEYHTGIGSIGERMLVLVDVDKLVPDLTKLGNDGATR